ncbi:hypothetical protein K438DRAFT_268407 [Mycena galopus ATCC 62051]|nr:hypothetical protein K438DRAFT_268407 [Mycena galopus ATCC 62051]
MRSWDGHPLRGEVMPNGWTQVEYLNNEESSFWMNVQLDQYYEPVVKKWWISQQNYVRKHLQRAISAEEEDFRLFTDISLRCHLDTRLDGYTLQGTFMADAPSHTVYLFLFRPQVEIIDGCVTVAFPPETKRSYWTFDPEGLDRLTHAVAEDIGLPTPEFSLERYEMEWNECIDDQLHEFHAVKEFDPDSRDAAIAWGYPLVDIEALRRSAQELISPHSMTVPDPDEAKDQIYYSLGLC